MLYMIIVRTYVSYYIGMFVHYDYIEVVFKIEVSPEMHDL